jgi:hypothetical protein
MSQDPANLPPKAGTIAEHRLHETDTGSPEADRRSPTASTTSPST